MAYGGTLLDANGIPMGSTIVPGTAAPVPLQGGTAFTDALGNLSAPARMEVVPGSRATYSYSINALAMLASQTDIMVLRGSATKLVKVVHFEMSGGATTSQQVLWFLKKHTTANTGGTGTLGATVTQHDSADGAATAVLNTYQTTLPTVGTATIWRVIRLNQAPLAATALVDRYSEDFGDFWEPMVLRGVAQEFALNFNGVTLTGGTVDFTIVWTEE
jgi:hypothetical protein